MDEFKNFDTVSDYNRFHNNDTLHPLVSVVDYSKSEPHGFFNMRLGFYAIILKDVKCGEMKYGRNFYDYDEDTLLSELDFKFCIAQPLNCFRVAVVKEQTCSCV